MKMKSWKKRVLAGTVAGLMLMATSAFAAEYTSLEASVDGENITVTYAENLAEGDQLTILAYKVDDDTSKDEAALDPSVTPSDTNITHIDQFEKTSDSGSTLSFVLGNGLSDGWYKLLMGGTNVSTARTAYFKVGGGSVTPGTYSITGTVEFNGGGDAAVATVKLYNGEDEIASVEATAKAFTFTQVANGTYKIVASLPKHTTATATGVTVSDANYTLDETLKMIAGDLNGDGAITGLDLTAVTGNFGTENADYDLNADGSVTGLDLTLITGSFGAEALTIDKGVSAQ